MLFTKNALTNMHYQLLIFVFLCFEGFLNYYSTPLSLGAFLAVFKVGYYKFVQIGKLAKTNAKKNLFTQSCEKWIFGLDF